MAVALMLGRSAQHHRHQAGCRASPRCTCTPTADQMQGEQMEYEDILPFPDFSFRVPQHMIYMLPQLLTDLVTDEPDQVCILLGHSVPCSRFCRAGL